MVYRGMPYFERAELQQLLQPDSTRRGNKVRACLRTICNLILAPNAARYGAWL